MKLIEIYLTNETIAKINLIKLDFDQDYSNLKNLIEYLKSSKCPYVYDEYLIRIKSLEQRIRKFLNLGNLLDWSDPDLNRFKLMAESLDQLLKDLQN